MKKKTVKRKKSLLNKKDIESEYFKELVFLPMDERLVDLYTSFASAHSVSFETIINHVLKDWAIKNPLKL